MDEHDRSIGDEKTIAGGSAERSLGDVETLAYGSPCDSDVSIGDLPTIGNAPGASSADEGFEGKALSDRYENLEEIGRGGFAVVYKARDKRLRREVVVKRLHFEQAGMDEAIIRKRFEHEAHAIAALNHPNIVQVYDYDRDADGHYIVMEYVPGGSLKDRLKEKGKLEVQEAIATIKSVCEGLSFAHRKNLIHRDIKPANILLSQNVRGTESEEHGGGRLVPKIADFGLARAGFETGQSMSLSMSGTGMGTLLKGAVDVEYGGFSLRVPSLSDLIAMKLFALGNPKREERDSTDIVHLVVDNKMDLETELKPLCNRFATDEIYRKLVGRIEEINHA